MGEQKASLVFFVVVAFISLCMVIMSSCITTNSKITVTDPNGNCVTFTEDQIDINLKQLEKDGYTVDIESTVELDEE